MSLRGQFAGFEHQIWTLRWLIRIGDPGEKRDLTLAGLAVETLGIPLLADVQGRVDEDFKEPQPFLRFDHASDPLAILAVRAHEGRQADQSCRSHQTSHCSDAAKVLLAVLGGKTQAESLGKT